MSYQIKNISIVSINEPSFQASLYLANILKDDYALKIYNKNIDENEFKKYGKLDDEIMQELWESDAIIFILATGIVVRKIAPFLEHKTKDPAVIVASIDLLKFLPLLSGHIGGANELCEELCSKIDGAISFTTTATDQTKTFAFDMFAKKMNFEIRNIKYLAKISNRLINKQDVYVYTYKSIFDCIEIKDNLIFKNIEDESLFEENSVIISPFYKECENLFLVPKIFVGIGMNRGTSKDDISSSVEWLLQKYNLKFSAIESFNSFIAKSDEEGLLEYINEKNLPINFFEEDEINSLENDFSKSQATKFFGLKGVSEPSSILASKYKELVVKKEVYEGKITLAIAV